MCLMLLFVGHYCFRSNNLRRWQCLGIALFFVESGLWFLLCKTYSRGALLAAVCGLLFYFISNLIFPLRGLSRIRVFAGLLLRFVLLAGLLWGTGFFGRIDPGFVAQDASVGNRRVLWEGGVQMIWHKPLAGWGVGESGPQFMHWFQPVDATAKYAGMVNSYLHIAVERGLPFLLLCVSVLIAFVYLALFRSQTVECDRRGSRCACLLASAAVIVVFLVANVFNTLWIFPRLWIPVGIAGLIIVTVLVLGRSRLSVLKRSFYCAIVSSSLLGAALLALGCVLTKKAPYRIRFEGDMVVLRGRADGGPVDSQWLLAMDPQVFGEDWGKEVRRLAEELQGRAIELVILTTSANAVQVDAEWYERFLGEPKLASSRVLLTSGRLSPPLDLSRSMDQVIWLHPHATEMPLDEDFTEYNSILLLFPMMDLSGGQAKWKRVARQFGWGISSSGALTDDLRPAWPGCVLQLLLEGRLGESLSLRL
jgi:hypothetical protein